MARPKSDTKREQKGLRLRSDVMTAMGHLSVDLKAPLNVLVEEALQDFLEKHGRKLEVAKGKEEN